MEIKAGAEYSKKFFEDASWGVMERQTAEVGRAIAELETEKILELYDEIDAADLAGGSQYNGGGTLNWEGLVGFWNRIKAENFNAKVLVINPAQLADLWQQDQFIHSFYFGGMADIRRGILGETYLGMKIVVSTKVAAGTVYCIDTDVAATMLLRRGNRDSGDHGCPMDSEYDVATGTEATSGDSVEDETLGHGYYNSQTTPTADVSNDTEGSPAVIDSTDHTAAGKTKAVVLQCKVANDAVQGEQADETLSFKYDEI